MGFEGQPVQPPPTTPKIVDLALRGREILELGPTLTLAPIDS